MITLSKELSIKYKGTFLYYWHQGKIIYVVIISQNVIPNNEFET